MPCTQRGLPLYTFFVWTRPMSRCRSKCSHKVRCEQLGRVLVIYIIYEFALFLIIAPVPPGRPPPRLFTIEINSAIMNNLKPIKKMKMQCEAVYPNSHECVFDYMKNHHNRFWTLRTLYERSWRAEDLIR